MTSSTEALEIDNADTIQCLALMSAFQAVGSTADTHLDIQRIDEACRQPVANLLGPNHPVLASWSGTLPQYLLAATTMHCHNIGCIGGVGSYCSGSSMTSDLNTACNDPTCNAAEIHVRNRLEYPSTLGVFFLAKDEAYSKICKVLFTSSTESKILQGSCKGVSFTTYSQSLPNKQIKFVSFETDDNKGMGASNPLKIQSGANFWCSSYKHNICPDSSPGITTAIASINANLPDGTNYLIDYDENHSCLPTSIYKPAAGNSASPAIYGENCPIASTSNRINIAGQNVPLWVESKCTGEAQSFGDPN